MWGDVLSRVLDSKKSDKISILNEITSEERGVLLKKLSETLKFSKYGVFNAEHDKIIAEEKSGEPEQKNSDKKPDINYDSCNRF